MLLERTLVFPTAAAHKYRDSSVTHPRLGGTKSGCNLKCSEKRALMKTKLFRNGSPAN